MGKTMLKTPCKRPINTNVFKEVDCWQIECNDGQIIVTSNIDYINYNKNFVGFISVEDVISNDVFMIPTNSISIIKKIKLISVKFYCSSEEETSKETNKYVCHYTISHHNEYVFNEYGQNPISWYNFS